jgi:hypothetical protein
MKQILEVGNIANFINNCEKAFVVFSEKTKVLEDYDDYSKYSRLIFVGRETTQFALIDNGVGKKTTVVKRFELNEETEYSTVKLENGLFGTNNLNKLYFTKVQQIKDAEANELRLEAEEKANNIVESKRVFNEKIGVYTTAFNKMMQVSTNNGEYITEIADEPDTFPTATFKIVLPPINKGGKITVNIMRFTPFGNMFAIFEPMGHPNDQIFNLKTQYIETFKNFLKNEQNI